MNSLESNSPQTAVINPFESFDAQKFFHRIISIWPFVLAFTLFTISLGWVYLRYAAPTYKAGTAILIKEDRKGSASFSDNPLLRELNASSMTKLLDNEIEIIKSYDLMDQVVRNLDLNVSYRAKGRFVERVVYNPFIPFQLNVLNEDDAFRTQIIQLSKNEGKGWQWKVEGEESSNLWRNLEYNKAERVGDIIFSFTSNLDSMGMVQGNLQDLSQDVQYYIRIEPITSSVKYFSRLLSVTPTTETGSIIGIELIDYSEKRAVAILNELVRVYNYRNFEDKNLVSSNTVKFLDERLSLFERDLKNIENKVATYKSENLVTTIASTSDQYLALSGEIDKLKAAQRGKLNLVEALESEVIKNQENPALVPSTLGISEPSLLYLIQRHNDLILQRERMQSKAGSKNPIIVDLNGQIRDIRASLVENISNLKKAYKGELKEIDARDYQLTGKLSNMPEVEKRLLQITRDRNVMEQLYLFLLQKREENAIALAGSVIDGRIIEKSKSKGQVSPKVQPVWVIALLSGLFLPIFFVILVDLLDNKVGDRIDVEQNCLAPVLGEIGFIKNLKSNIIIKPGDRSAVSEQIRSIRTSLEFTAKGKSLKKILITSHRPNEGKSFTSLNLAASYSLLNKKTVILEFDLRKPRLAKYLGLSANVGISSFLVGKAQLDQIVKEVPDFDGNFFIIPAGPIPPNPAELVYGPNMDDLMKQLEERFDIIIIDTPPFTLVADPELLSRHADLYIVVLRQGYSFKSVFNELNIRISKRPDPPIYVVLNSVGRLKRYSSQYSNNSYGYGYGYGYYSDDKKKVPIFRRFLNFFRPSSKA